MTYRRLLPCDFPARPMRRLDRKLIIRRKLAVWRKAWGLAGLCPGPAVCVAGFWGLGGHYFFLMPCWQA